jgi:Brp/Blh family beta-carotene 15,15'-monooxygenase
MGTHVTRDALPQLVPDTPGGTALAVSRWALLALTAGFAVWGLTDLAISLRVQAAVYLLGMVAMNLPHGGYEHFENLRRRDAGVQVRYVAAYLAAIALFVALFFAAPVVGLAVALAVAVAKGGFGDLGVLGATSGTDHLRTRPQRWLAAVVRGGPVMLVPMVFWPDTFYAFSSLMVGIFEPGALAAVAGDVYRNRILIGVGYGAFALAHVALGYRRATGSGAWRADVAELALLVAYFATVPVVIAVGLYFPLWYSARQVARSNAVDAAPVESEGAFDGLLAPLDGDDPTRIALGAWGVLVVGALTTGGLAALLWVLSPRPLGGAGPLVGLVAFWSVFVSIIALPHVVVGSWLDRGRGIWYVP